MTIRRSTALLLATILALAMLAGMNAGTEKARAAGGSLAGWRFCVDAGHGGSDPGAVGPTGRRESDVNLTVAKDLKSLLESRGATVYMTREADVDVSISARYNYANNLKVDRFISVHHNATGDNVTNYTMVLIAENASPESRQLGERVVTQLSQVLGIPKTALGEKGVWPVDYVGVLNHTNMPAILTEAAFISNTAQETKLRDPNYLQKEAEAIAMGVDEAARIAITSPSDTALLGGQQPIVLNLFDTASVRQVDYYLDGQPDGVETTAPYGHTLDTTKYSDGKRSLQVDVEYTDGKIYSTTRDLLISNAARNWYFAEGTTRKGFDEYLTFMNPNDADTPFELRYCFADGSYSDRVYSVPHKSRMTIWVNNDVGPEKDVSCIIQADNPLVVERPMYFDYTSQASGAVWQGGHNVLGVNQPALNWYFAEGCTAKNFEEYLCLVNPGDQDAAIDIFYMPTDGKVISKQETVGAHARKTIFVNNDAGPNLELSVKIVSTNNVPIVAERPLYFNFGGSWPGGSDVMGATADSLQWYFAEGYTGTGFSEWLCLQNAGSVPADVTVSYFFKDGGGKTQALRIPPYSRHNISVNQDVGPDKEVSVSVTSNVPIVAERPLYYNYHNWAAGGDAVMGANRPASDWFFAEGYTGSGFEEWLCLMNPATVDSRVVATFIKSNGDSITRAYHVPAHSRFTILVNQVCSCEVSVVLHASLPVVAERPLYFVYGKDAGGSAGVGFSPGLPR